MELKTIYSNTEPTDKNVIWLQIVDGVPVSKVFTANGRQPIGKEQSGTGIIELSSDNDPEVIKEKLKNIDISQPFVCIIDGLLAQSIPTDENSLCGFVCLYSGQVFTLDKYYDLMEEGPVCDIEFPPFSPLFIQYLQRSGRVTQPEFYERLAMLIDSQS